MKQEQTFLILFRIAILPDGSLRILNASKSDEGKYICQGENIFGSAEIIASLSVKEPTRIELTPKRTELTVGESIVLSCKAIHDSSLEVTFYWTLKGQPIDFEKEGGHFENIRAQASSADLMIRNILLMHAGRYGCRVQTTADSVSDEAELLVRAGGSWGVGRTQNENMKLRPQTSTSSSSALSGCQVPLWEAPLKCPWVTFDLTREVGGTGKDGSASTRLEREALDVNPVAGRIAKEDKRTLRDEGSLDEVGRRDEVLPEKRCGENACWETSAPNYPTTGLLWPSAGAGAEHLHPADEVDGGMKMSPGPPGPPGVVIVEEITESTATLSWSPATDNHSPISSYNLQARSPFSLGWQTVKTVPEVITGDMESAMAVDLNPWVEYEFRVVATNPIGTGDPSIPSRMIRTNEAVPKTAPSNVSGRSGRRHELVIAWEPVSEEFQNGEGFGYIVAFRPNGTRGWKEKMVTSSEASKFIYRDESVPPLTPFEVKVGVYNNKGDGPFSQIVVICSAEGEPTAAPTDVKATSVSVSEILVTWKHRKESLGRPQGFEV
uniref:contactin-5-like n=1 Tax=Myodes glareolus TaxID=447135 RepID=UPI00201FBD89|nr:contactin-5-like [Myodes glareolus]